MTARSNRPPARVEIAATGHLVVVTRDGDDVCPWVVTIGAGEGPGREVARFDALQPAELLVDDLLTALEIVARDPVRPGRAGPTGRARPG